MKKIYLFILIIGMAYSFTAASQHGIKMEKPDERSHYRPTMYGGFFAGNYASFDKDELHDDGNFVLLKNSVKVGGELGYRFTNTSSVYGDFNFSFPNGGFGILVGYQQALLPLQIAPFLGVGLGFMHFLNTSERQHLDLGERYTMNANANVGVNLLRLEKMNIRLRVNYDLFINKNVEHGLGADLSFLFFFGNPKIRELSL